MNRYVRRFAVLLLAAALWIPAAGPGEEEVTPTPAPATRPAATVLRSGSKGDDVKQLQERLIELGYEPGTPDGVFGKGTKTAVKEFQRRNGLDPDGEAGPKTLEILYSDAAVAVPKPEEVDVLAGDLPMLVNKTHPVDEFLLPADLVLLEDVLDSNLVKIKYKDTKAVREAAEALEEMLEAAKADGVTKWQVSTAYRSYAQQEKMLDNKISSYLKSHSEWSRSKARSAALRTVAEPGCSEHQLGLAIDINVPGASAFKGTKQCKWLHEHCWEYGFIVRYTADKKDITGYEAEEWHIRYVGVDHALRIRELGLCLEEYLDGIADGTILLPGETAPDGTGETEEADAAEGPVEIGEIFLDDDTP